MLSLINQFKRLRYDDGRNDKSFFDQEHRLKDALERLKNATEAVVRASHRLSYLLSDDNDKDALQ